MSANYNVPSGDTEHRIGYQSQEKLETARVFITKEKSTKADL